MQGRCGGPVAWAKGKSRHVTAKRQGSEGVGNAVQFATILPYDVGRIPSPIWSSVLLFPQWQSAVLFPSAWQGAWIWGPLLALLVTGPAFVPVSRGRAGPNTWVWLNVCSNEKQLMVSRAPGLAHSLPSHVKWKSSCSGKCRHTQECLEMSEESWGPLIMSGCQVPAAKSRVSHLSWLPELGCGLWYGRLSPCLGGAVYKQCISVTAVGRRREHGRLQGEYQQAGTNGPNP